MPWTTVFGNVYLPLKLEGVSKSAARSRVMETLSSVGLADFAEAYPRELSGGMKMRVSIARALVTKPKLLLMDEPFAALDEITRQKLNDDVLRLWRQSGVTVIFVTHSVFESAYLSNRIVVMKARPGQVSSDIPLATSSDRDANYRTSEEYRATTDRVSRALQMPPSSSPRRAPRQPRRSSASWCRSRCSSSRSSSGRSMSSPAARPNTSFPARSMCGSR
jgi:NitT/TauT family transport system ATP-binding protein